MGLMWVTDGQPVPLHAAPGRRSRWHVGRFEFTHWPKSRTGPGSRGRWGCTSDGRGVAACRTPLGALVALLRWEREQR